MSTDSSSKLTPEKSGGDLRVISNGPEMKGWLLKWTNYIKGYQRRWFMLSKGVLSYYRNQSEMGHTCRGTISLHGALIHTVDSCTFVISNGGTQTFHIKAVNEVERQSWVTALELAKAKAIRAMENEEDEEVESAHVVPSQEINSAVRDLTDRLENLHTCYDLITKHGIALQRALSDLETNEEETLASRTKIVNERATLYRITSNAMINACNDYLRTAEAQGHKWSKMLQHEREQRQRLEEMVEQLAKQHTQLEHMVQQKKNVEIRSALLKGSPSGPGNTAVTSDEESEFFDAEDNNICFEEVTALNGEDNLSSFEEVATQDDSFANNSADGRRMSTQEQGSSSSENDEQQKMAAAPMFTTLSIKESVSSTQDTVDRSLQSLTESSSNEKVIKKRRTRVPNKPDYPLNLWSIMKNCIGKELSKIPMPVNFNEPISMLQRLTEDYEYAELLDKAARCKDACEQLAYVAAFTISSYSTTANRTGKPFNPLLGETFEFDRTDDLGWRVVAEQVSHHPPMAAIYCEGRKWNCWQEFTMTSKFRGKYLQVIPLGNAYAHFPRHDQKYVWRKVTTQVNNIIVGKLWVDHQGEMEIKGLNAAAGYKCVLRYIPYSYFSRETQRRVQGMIMNRSNEVKYVLRGTWDTKIEVAAVHATTGRPDAPIYKTGSYKTIWSRRLPAPDSDKYYNFTEFACQLNELEDGVAPTDSRLRPDQRLMEQGMWDDSNLEKVRLEEKQRLKRRQREAEAEKAAEEGRPYPPYTPIWFTCEKEDGSDCVSHVFKGTYWEHKLKQDWSVCPNIY